MLSLTVNIYLHSRLKILNIDKVSYGKTRVVEKMAESTGKVQVLGQFTVKPLIPVGRCALSYIFLTHW